MDEIDPYGSLINIEKKYLKKILTNFRLGTLFFFKTSTINLYENSKN
jgi:hypothetical protein